MRGPFPNIKPYQTHQLAVSEIHTLYIEECGNPDGMPVLVLQDEPGLGCQPYHRQFFNPERYRIILFDQRGSGRAAPQGELKDNHTTALLDDISHIRQHLEVTQWLVFGNYWGATLALLYAQAHPFHLFGLVLSNVFLGREEDIDWIFSEGAHRFYPEQWEAFQKGVRVSERHDLLPAYYQQLTGNNDIAQRQAAKKWANWLDTLSAEELSNDTDVSRSSLGQARIEAHFYHHQCFLKGDQIMNNVHRLEEIPGIILHGRYSIVSPLINAWRLKRQWGDTAISVLPDVGHNLFAPAMTEAILNATFFFAEQYGA